MKVLIVEDDTKIADFLKLGLGKAGGFQIQISNDGKKALSMALHENFELFIIDIMLPQSDGLDLVSSLRNEGVKSPALILSANRSVDDRALALQKGSDDYLTKPFDFSELFARCQALVRRFSTHQDSPRRWTYEDMSIDLLSREAFRGGSKINLQAKEFTLLEYSLLNPEVVHTKSQILKYVGNYNFDPQTNVVDVLVCRLRNKIDKDFNEKTIKTIRGVGYVLEKN